MRRDDRTMTSEQHADRIAKARQHRAVRAQAINPTDFTNSSSYVIGEPHTPSAGEEISRNWYNYDSSYAARQVGRGEGYWADAYNLTIQKIAEGNLSSKNEKIYDIQQEKEDINRIIEYKQLKSDLDNLISGPTGKYYRDLAQGKVYTDTEKFFGNNFQTEKNRVEKLVTRINELDDYFKGEGRSHAVIAREMYDLKGVRDSWNLKDKANIGLEYITAENSPYSWSENNHAQDVSVMDPDYKNKPNDDGVLSKIGRGIKNFIPDLFTGVGNALQMTFRGGFYTFSRPGEWAGDLKYTVEQEAVQNMPQGHYLIDKLYKGHNSQFAKSSNAQLREYLDEDNRQLNEAIVDQQSAVDFYKRGTVKYDWFGLRQDDPTEVQWYNPNGIRDEYLQKKQENDEKFLGGFWNPVYSIPEIGSSLGLFGGNIATMGIDMVLSYVSRKLPVWVAKVAPQGRALKAIQAAMAAGEMEKAAELAKNVKNIDRLNTIVGAGQTAINAANIGAGLYFTRWSREQETAQEAMGALVERTLAEAQGGGADMQKVVGQISSTLNKIGIDTKGLPEDKIVELGIAHNIHTGDRAFDYARKDANKGLQKLINANNALAYSDFLETLPFLSYGGSTLRKFANWSAKTADKYGLNFAKTAQERAADAVLRERDKVLRGPVSMQTRRLREMGLDENYYKYMPSLQGAIDKKIGDVVKKIEGSDIEKLKKAGRWLLLKRTADYAIPTIGKVIGVGVKEGIEEANQQLLQNRYTRGYYDDYIRSEQTFSLGEMAADLNLSAEAIADYLGINFGDEFNGDKSVRVAANLGAVASIYIPAVLGGMSNLHRSNANNLRNYFKQLKNDRVVKRILASNYQAVQDDAHLEMFIDAFHKKGVDRNALLKSLDSFKDYIPNGSLISPDFIDGDKKLMNAAWSLYNSKTLLNDLNEQGIKKYSREHKDIIKLGARALVDEQMSREQVNKDSEELRRRYTAREQLLVKMLSPDTSAEELEKLRTDNPQMAAYADLLRGQYNARREKERILLQKAIDSGDEDVLQKVARIWQFIDANYSESSESVPLDDVDRKKIQDTIDKLEHTPAKNLAEHKKAKNKIAKLRKKLKAGVKDGQVTVSKVQNALRDSQFADKYMDQYTPFSSDLTDYAKSQLYGQCAYERLSAAEALRNHLSSREVIMSELRKITGLDVDTDKIAGLTRALDDIIKNLHNQESKQFTENGLPTGTYKSYFKDSPFLFDDADEVKTILNRANLNRAALIPQSKIASMYRAIGGNPNAINSAISREGEENQEIDLSDIQKRYNEIAEELTNGDELERNARALQEEGEALEKKAAWRVIHHQLKDLGERRKIAHRVFVEETPITPGEVTEQIEREEVPENENNAETPTDESTENTDKQAEDDKAARAKKVANFIFDTTGVTPDQSAASRDVANKFGGVKGRDQKVASSVGSALLRGAEVDSEDAPIEADAQPKTDFEEQSAEPTGEAERKKAPEDTAAEIAAGKDKVSQKEANNGNPAATSNLVIPPPSGQEKTQRKRMDKQLNIMRTATDSLDVINAIFAIRQNDEGGKQRGVSVLTAEEYDEITKKEDELHARGYEWNDVRAGMKYDEGMKTNASFTPDETLPAGAQVIDHVSTPQINRDGAMIQCSVINVRQSTKDTIKHGDTEYEVRNEHGTLRIIHTSGPSEKHIQNVEITENGDVLIITRVPGQPDIVMRGDVAREIVKDTFPEIKVPEKEDPHSITKSAYIKPELSYKDLRKKYVKPDVSWKYTTMTPLELIKSDRDIDAISFHNALTEAGITDEEFTQKFISFLEEEKIASREEIDALKDDTFGGVLATFLTFYPTYKTKFAERYLENVHVKLTNPVYESIEVKQPELSADNINEQDGTNGNNGQFEDKSEHPENDEPEGETVEGTDDGSIDIKVNPVVQSKTTDEEQKRLHGRDQRAAAMHMTPEEYDNYINYIEENEQSLYSFPENYDEMLAERWDVENQNKTNELLNQPLSTPQSDSVLLNDQIQQHIDEQREQERIEMSGTMRIDNLGKLEYQDGQWMYEGQIVPPDLAAELIQEQSTLNDIDMLFDYSGVPSDEYSTKPEQAVTKDEAADYVSSTFFYQPDATEPMTLSGVYEVVNGKVQVDQFARRGYELRPGKELSEHLIKPGWVSGCHIYYIVTKAESSTDDPDTFTVSMVIEDPSEKKCYTCALRQLGTTEDYKHLTDKGKPRLRDFAQELRIKLRAIRVNLKDVQGDTTEEKLATLQREQAEDMYNAVSTNDKKPELDPSVYDETGSYDVDAYNKWKAAVNAWKGRAYDWAFARVQKHDGESEESYKKRIDDRNKRVALIREKARFRLRKAGKSPLTEKQIEEQIERLRQFRRSIIDAYCAKDEAGKYIIPETISDKVQPQTVCISNGRLNNNRTDAGIPIFSKVCGDDSVEAVQAKLNSGEVSLGYGLGVNGAGDNKYAIVHIGMGRNSNLIQHRGRGLSGKIYWIITSHNGDQVPVMLREQKFNTQRGSKTGYISKAADVELCIDPDTGVVVDDNSKVKPSAAEVLLYMITGKINGQYIPGGDSALKDLVELFINTGDQTICNKKDSQRYLGAFAAKQISWHQLTDGGEYVLTIGMKQPDGTYAAEDFTYNQLFGAGSEGTRKRVIAAIATQMHWNTEKQLMHGTFLSNSHTANVIKSIQSFFENNDVESISICGVDEFTFKRDDFFTKDKRTGKLIPKDVSIAAWMLANGKLTTDLAETPLVDPFIFGTGIKENAAAAALHTLEEEKKPAKSDPAIQVAGEEKTAKKPQPANITSAESQAIIDEMNDNASVYFGKRYGTKKLEIGDVPEGYDGVWAIRYDTSKRTPRDIRQNIKEKFEDFVAKYNAQRKADGKNPLPVDADTVKLLNDDAQLSQWNGVKSKTQLPFVYIYDGKIEIVPSDIDTELFDDKVTGAFSRTRGSGKINTDQAREWIQKTLGINPWQVIVTDAVMRSCEGEEVFGVTNVMLDRLANEMVGTIQLRSDSGSGVEFHEAWHYVNLLVHNSIQREIIYSSYEKEHPNLKGAPYKVIEEAMAEDFRDYMEMRTAKGIKGKIKRLFNDVLDLISATRRKSEYRHVYRTIRKGQYAGSKLDKSSVEQFKARYNRGANYGKFMVPNVSQTLINKMEHMNTAEDFYTVCRACVNYLMNRFRPTTVREMRDLATNADGISMAIRQLANSRQLAKPQNKKRKMQVMDVYNNIEVLRHMLLEEFSKYGINAKIRKLKQLSTNDQTVDDQTNDEALDKEENPENQWDKFDLSISKKDNAALRTKLFLRAIPIYRVEYNEDGSKDYIEQKDIFGIQEYWPYDETWNKILDDLWDCDSYDERDANSMNGVYTDTSLRGKVKNLAKSDAFYYSVDKMLDSLDGEKQGDEIIESDNTSLKSELYATINSSKPQIAFFNITDPVTHQSTALLDMAQELTDEALNNLTSATEYKTADRRRNWKLYADNMLRAVRALPRKWSSNILVNGLQEGDRVNENYVNRVVNLYKELTKLARDYNPNVSKNSKRNNNLTEDKVTEGARLLSEKFIELCNIMAIPMDNLVLGAYIEANRNILEEGNNAAQLSQRQKLMILHSVVTSQAAGTVGSFVGILEKTAASHASNDLLGQFNIGRGKTKPLDKLYNNFKDGSQISKIARAYASLHPSSKEFSVKGPNGDMLYPISQNNMISDRIRQINDPRKCKTGGIIDNLMNSPYAQHSKLLEIANVHFSKMASVPSDMKLKLNAFVGIKDGNSQKGADYFGITPFEDYLCKIRLMEEDHIVLPTMADKKTYYSISSGLLKMCHDLVLYTPNQSSVNSAIYTEYEKHIEDPKPKRTAKIGTDEYRAQSNAIDDWEKRAKEWYSEIEELAAAGDENAADIYANVHETINGRMGDYVQRYQNQTLQIFAGYFIDELNSLIDYYSRDNIQKLLTGRRRENYDGDVYTTKSGQQRLDFSGNGGKFRYFYDIMKYLYPEGINGFKFGNFNQYLEFLYKAQQHMEENAGTDVKPGEVFAETTTGSLYERNPKTNEILELDGFELIRDFLSKLKNTYFDDWGGHAKSGSASAEMLNAFNRKLIEQAKREVYALCGRNMDDPSKEDLKYSSIKCMDWDDEQNTFKPYGFPVDLIRRYTKKLAEKGFGLDSYNPYNWDDESLRNAAFSIIANHVANTAISVIETEKVFSGDPAQYKRKNIKGTFGKEQATADVELSDGTIIKVKTEVSNLGDPFSDKIKRLGGLLSPGEELRLQYSELELEEHPELRSTKYTNLNVEDLMAKSMFLKDIEELFRKQLVVDYIRIGTQKQREDFVKKIRQLAVNHAKEQAEKEQAANMTFEQCIDKIYHHRVYVEAAVNILGKETAGIIEKSLRTQMSPYEDITVSDAQVIIRPELYRKIRIGLGQWSFEKDADADGYCDETAFNILQSDSEWMHNPEKARIVRKLELFPLKMSYFQNENDGESENSVNEAIYNKMAIFPLFKYTATSETSKALYDRMNKPGEELDMISFKSAVKVGGLQHAPTLTTGSSDKNIARQTTVLSDDINLPSDKAVNYKTGAVEPKNETSDKVAHVTVQDLSNLRMQLNTHSHEAEDRAIGTQMFKIAFSNIIDEAMYGTDKEGHPQRSGTQIKADIIACINALTSIGAAKLHDRFYNRGRDGKYYLNKRAVDDFVKLIAHNNGLGTSAEEILNAGNVIASLMSRTVFENSLSAVVTGEIVDINTNGGTAIQQSMFGFAQYGKQVVATQTGSDVNPEADTEAGAYYNDDGFLNYNGGRELKWNAKEGSMQVMLSMNFFRSVVPQQYQTSFETMRKWLFDNNIIGENAKPFGVGYRIPTQGMSSMFAFQVADVLPEQSGDLIVVPREFTAQTGSDFDVDKLFLATFSYEDGKLCEFNNTDLRNFSSFSKKDGAPDTKHAQKAMLEDSQTYNRQTSEYKTGAITNRLLADYIDIISDKRNFADSRASIDFVTNMITQELLPQLDAGRTQYFHAFDDLLPSFQSFEKEQFSIGKQGIGPFALNITNLALTQYLHMSMDYGDNIYDLGHLDEIYGQDGIRISAWLSAMVNAHVDVAKDPYVFILNVNKYTYNHTNFLLRAGKGISTFSFLAQPILKELAARVNNSGGIYGNNINGSQIATETRTRSNKIKKEIISKYFHKLRDDYDNNREQVKGDTDLVQSIISVIDYFEFGEKHNGNFGNKKLGNLDEIAKDVFDYNKAVSAIRGMDSSDAATRIRAELFQLYTIKAYNDIQTYADELAELVRLSRIDNKKFGNTITSHMNFENQYEQFRYSAQHFIVRGNSAVTSAKDAVEYYQKSLYLNDKFYKAVEFTRDILKHQTFTATDQYRQLYTSVCSIIAGTTTYTYEENGENKEITFYNPIRKEEVATSIGKAIDNVARFNMMLNTSIPQIVADRNNRRVWQLFARSVWQSGYTMQDGKLISTEPPYKHGLFPQGPQKQLFLGGHGDSLVPNRFLPEDNDPTLLDGPIDFTMDGNPNTIAHNMRRLLYGTDTELPLFRRLSNLIQDARTVRSGKAEDDRFEKYGDLLDNEGNLANELLLYLWPQAPTEKYPVGRILLNESQMNTSSDKKSRLTSAFEVLLSSGNEEIRKLARDLAWYAYYSEYDQNVKDSFFDLVPMSYRIQYDSALKYALARGGQYLDAAITPNAQYVMNYEGDLVQNPGRAALYIDVISRNYWYDDNIVPPINVGKGGGSIANQWGTIYYAPSVLRGNGGNKKFYGCILTTNQMNDKPYVKMVKGNHAVLYKQVGCIRKTWVNKKTGKQNTNTDWKIFLAVPKAGIHSSGNNQYEFYADYGTPSIFEDNKIPEVWAPSEAIDWINNLCEGAQKQLAGKGVKVECTFTNMNVPAVYMPNEAGILNYDVFTKTNENGESANTSTSDGSLQVVYAEKDPDADIINAILGKNRQLNKHGIIIDLNSATHIGAEERAVRNNSIEVNIGENYSGIGTRIFDLKTSNEKPSVKRKPLENIPKELIQRIPSQVTNWFIPIYFSAENDIASAFEPKTKAEKKQKQEEIAEYRQRFINSQIEDMRSDPANEEKTDEELLDEVSTPTDEYINTVIVQQKANEAVNSIVQNLLASGVRISSLYTAGNTVLSKAVAYAAFVNRNFFSSDKNVCKLYIPQVTGIRDEERHKVVGKILANTVAQLEAITDDDYDSAIYLNENAMANLLDIREAYREITHGKEVVAKIQAEGEASIQQAQKEKDANIQKQVQEAAKEAGLAPNSLASLLKGAEDASSQQEQPVSKLSASLKGAETQDAGVVEIPGKQEQHTNAAAKTKVPNNMAAISALASAEAGDQLSDMC